MRTVANVFYLLAVQLPNLKQSTLISGDARKETRSALSSCKAVGFWKVVEGRVVQMLSEFHPSHMLPNTSRRHEYAGNKQG